MQGEQQQQAAERGTAGTAGVARAAGSGQDGGATASEGAPRARTAPRQPGGSRTKRGINNPSPRLSSCSSSGLEGKSEESEIHHYAQAVRLTETGTERERRAKS